ncbi:alpha/beta hydrolase-fold protein [Bifidobacterium amazonense]|uniref:Alpha/beta hydrolase-fold protein n=1 Tax=Bifidobacterium amazonense TaxID=2809027 RepID=A0ABS9VYH9_9BIFI|nr:alpha/beta hydrolase-fold protein [Bifidobacterium amazonense]MCH9277039.1 alpha/beta hydrolase-fold protein [Bifidobacterium amazonense]
MRFTSHIGISDADVGDDTDDALLFVMFHGYGNDESEMVRIIDAVYRADHVPDADDVPSDERFVVTGPANALSRGSSASPSPSPSWLSFRGTVDRPYMGGSYWYPDGCGVDERRRACSAVGDAVVPLLDATAFVGRRKVLVGFSQGGYLSYRMVVEHPTLFDAAILLSPSFKGEEDSVLDSPTRFFLAYGSLDRTIPPADQRTARRVLGAAGHLEYHEYPDMAHAICDREIADIRAFLDR